MKKLYVILVLYLISTNVYSDNLDDKIKIFWNYIYTNEGKILNAGPTERNIYDEMYNQIQLIDENITVMLENKIINEKKNIIITANGNPDYFALCDRVVNLAPKFKILNPIALFPALDIIEPFVFYDIILNVEDVKVHFYFDNEENISLLFILADKHISKIQSDKSGQIYNIYMQMLSLMTQQILGERIMGTKIQSGEISLVNTLMSNIPIIELKYYIK